MQSICINTYTPLVIKRLRQIQHDPPPPPWSDSSPHGKEHRNISQASAFRPYVRALISMEAESDKIKSVQLLCSSSSPETTFTSQPHQFKQLIIRTRHTSQINRHNHLCLIRDRLLTFFQTRQSSHSHPPSPVFAPQCTITFAVAQYVYAGTIILIPSCTPNHRSTTSSPTVAEFTANVALFHNTLSVPFKLLRLWSSCIQPDFKVSTTHQ